MSDTSSLAAGTFVIDGAVKVMVTITEVGDGTLKIEAKVLDETGSIGDLRGLFFDVADESLISGLQIAGSSVTGTQFKEDGVSNLGSGNNVNGDIVNENGKFDAGVSFGTPGIGKDDIREATFILSHKTVDLTYDFLAVQDFAVRLTSVGEEGGNRNDSLKLGGTSPEASEPEFGSLSGRYFCDENDNDVDDAEPGIAGVLVDLLDENGNSTGVTTTTAADGSYSFTGLEPGTYGVKFTDTVSGKVLITPNVGSDDAIDSDATDLGGGMSQILGIVVVANEDTPDNDAGVELQNTPPEPQPDEACVCSDEMVGIDALANDGGSDGLTIIGIAGQSVSAGGSVTLASGAIVMLLADGTLKYDLSGDGDDFDDLLIGETVADSFEYTVSDGQGGEADATVDVEVHGALNTIETIQASLPSTITFEISENAFDPTFGPIDYDIIVSGTDPRLDGVIEAVYCVDPTTEVVPDIVIEGNLYFADTMSVPAGLVGRPENLDNLAWLMNQQFETQDNGDGTSGTYTGGEIQAAIWRLMTGQEYFVPGGGNPPQNAARANAAEIYNAALGSGDGFVPGEGDIVSLIVDPTDESEAETGFEQPFVIGVAFDDLKQDCDCDCDYLV